MKSTRKRNQFRKKSRKVKKMEKKRTRGKKTRRVMKNGIKGGNDKINYIKNTIRDLEKEGVHSLDGQRILNSLDYYNQYSELPLDVLLSFNFLKANGDLVRERKGLNGSPWEILIIPINKRIRELDPKANAAYEKAIAEGCSLDMARRAAERAAAEGGV